MKRTVRLLSVIMAVIMLALISAACSGQPTEDILPNKDGSKGDAVSDITEAPTEAPTQAPTTPEKPELTLGYVDCAVCSGTGYTTCGICQGTGVYKYTDYQMGPPPSYTLIPVQMETPCMGYGCKNGHVDCVSCHGSGKFEQYTMPSGKVVDPSTFDTAWAKYLEYYNAGYTDADLETVYDSIVYSNLVSIYGDIDDYTPSILPDDMIESGHTACHKCGGTGKVTCTSCDGTGKLSRTKYVPDYTGTGNNSYQQDTRCAACNGTGKCFCTACMGKGYY